MNPGKTDRSATDQKPGVKDDVDESCAVVAARTVSSWCERR
jgi:hypothetical protein